MKKRIIALVLVIIILVSTIPISQVTAASGDQRSWAQGNSAWANIKIGTSSSSKTMAQAGCAITAIAVAICEAGLRTAGNAMNGFTPGTFCNDLKSAGVLSSGGSITWGKVNTVVSGFNHVTDATYYTPSSTFSYFPANSQSSIASSFSYFLNKGYSIILEVPGSPQHYVTVLSVSGSTVYIENPSSGTVQSLFSKYSVAQIDAQGKPSGYGCCVLYKSNGSGHTTHTYTGSYYEAAHPHKEYRMCSCGATQYTGNTRSVSTCDICNPVSTSSKYNAVLSFKGYLKGTSKIYPYSTANLAATTGGEIWSTDECTISTVYTNGACKVSYPAGSTTKTAYTSLSNFIDNTSASLTKQTIGHQITTYIRASTSSTVYGYVSPGDVIYKLGTSGSMTQIFYPTGNGYKLAWVLTSELTEPTYDARFNPYCPIKGYPCATSDFTVYSSDHATSYGKIFTTDYCTLNAVYADGWCQVTYPASGGTKTAYTPLSNFVYNVSASHTKYTANTQITVYADKNLSNAPSWYVYVGDVFFVVSTYGSASQVLYPIDAQYGGGYKLGWIYTSALPKTTYTVSYNANGGSGVPSAQTKTHGTALTLSTTVPTRTGYAFVGWATSASATAASYAPGASYTTDANLSLYAVWTLNKYEISYNANGGTNAPSTQNKAHGTTLTLSTTVPVKHYTVTYNANGGTLDITNRQVSCTFLGWATSASATAATYQPGAAFTTNANTMLYAVWQNNTLEQYDFPVRTGYVFDGWYTAANGGSQVTTDTIVSSDMTIYAHWSVATYRVRFDANGGTGAPEEQVKVHGKNLTISTTIPTKKNYTFLGWATEENSTTVQYQPGGTYASDNDIMMIAVWRFNLNPTIQVGTVSAKAGERVTVPIRIVDNPGINTFTLGFSYDTARLKLTGVTVNPALGGQFTYGTKAVWFSGSDTEYTGEILSLSFDVLTTASVGDAAVTVSYANGDISNFNEENVDFKIVAGKVTVTQAHIHSYSYVLSKAPTASTGGTLSGTCNCGATTTVTLPKLNTTDYSYSVVKAASCTATGTGRYTWKTTTYGSYYFDVTIAKTAHTYQASVTAPTCTAQGYTTHTCSGCGDSYIDTYTAALGHSYSYKVTTTPTTSAAGKLTGTCTRSGCSSTTSVALPKLNTTDYSYSVTKAATCTATGTGRYTWKTTTYGSFYFDVTIAKTAHTYTATVTTPTCTAQGYTTHTCSGCGDSYIDTYTAALGHSYTYKVTTTPTTSAAGKLTGTCTRSGCGATTTVTLPKLNTTDYSYSVVKAASCTATGTGRYTWKTTTYGSYYFDVTIAKTAHNYQTSVTAPTCTAQGYTTHTCSGCGDSYIDTYTAALGHSYTYKVTTTPTTSAAGKLTGTCTRSGCSSTTSVALPKLNTTDYNYSVINAATCTTTGTARYTWKTTTYGNFYFDLILSALGHDYKPTVTEPSCTQQGYTTYICICGSSYVDSYTPPLGHSYSYKVTTTPTTSATGKLTGTCTRSGCGNTTTVTLPKLNTTDYSYSVVKAATCTANGTGRYTWKTTTYGTFSFDVTIAKTAHTYTATVTTPTCTEKGYTTHTCTVCGDSYKDTYTDALGHSWDDGVITTQPTEAKEGVKTFTCTRCGETRTESVPVLDHTHAYTPTVTAPTCTEKGYTTYTCSCGDSYVADYVAALGHDWDDGVVTTKPTETTEGVKTFTCSRCGTTKTESVPALDHTHSYTATVTPPTCTEKGYTTYTCACGDSYVTDFVAALGHNFVGGVCSRCGVNDPNYKPIDPDKPCDGGASCPGRGFTDMPKPNNWAHAGIDFCVENGLFAGTSATTFEPETAMNRAMLVTVLWRYEGSPKGYSNDFRDVVNGEWYADAVSWAAANGIVNGIEKGRFDPDGIVTREQMATILYRYSDWKGFDTSKQADFSSFPDAGKVGSWAKTAMQWAVAEGLIGGSKEGGKTYILPSDGATRAQVATILMRFVQNIAEK